MFKNLKWSDIQVIVLTLTAEPIGIDAENYFFGKLKPDHLADFVNLIDRSNFNRRRKRLSPKIVELNQGLANLVNLGADAYIVNSIPVPVYQISREIRSLICSEGYGTAPDKGYSAVSKAYYYGYKLHLVISVRGIFVSMDMSKANAHNSCYLSDVKCSHLIGCTLIEDEGYLSMQHQLDLFLCAISGWKHPKEVPKRTKNLLPISLRGQENESKPYSLNYATHLCSNAIIQKQIWVFLFYLKLQQRLYYNILTFKQ